MEVSNPGFISRLEQAIGKSRAEKALKALGGEASVSVRVNPLKIADGKVFGESGTVAVPWSAHGKLLEQRPSFTLDPLFHAGAYYVQDSSAMFVGHVFRNCLKYIAGKTGTLRVLDLCAAPGGKTTDLAASLREAVGDRFVLVANEVMRQRAMILSDNVARWGDPNVVVTSVDPLAFASLPGWFDIIVADVPCSGEGMFRKDDEAVKQWSEDNVALCAARQKRIIGDVWPALAEGGVLVYSTCTFNEEENDGNVRWIAGSLGAEVLPHETVALPAQDNGDTTDRASSDGFEVIKTEYGFSLVPGFVPGEGQYCAALKKTSEVDYPSADIFDDGAGVFRTQKRGRVQNRKTTGAALPQLTVVDALFDRAMSYIYKGETIVAVPTVIRADVEALAVLRPLMSGVAAGTAKGKDFVPHGDLALSVAYDKAAFPVVEADRHTALSFLHRDAIVLGDAPRGVVSVCYEGCPLGFVKNLGNRCNSLLPKDRRILMDINNLQ